MKLFKVDLAKFNEADKYIGPNKEVSFSLKQNEDFVRWGPNNDLCYWLANLATAPIHSSLIKYKATLIAGAGFLVDEEKNKDLAEFIKTNKLNQLLNKLAQDMATFNAFTAQILFNEKGNYIGKVVYNPMCSFRPQYSDEPTYCYLSKDWRQKNKKAFAPIKVDLFNPENINDVTKPQIYYWYKETPGNYFLPVEDYRGGLDYIQLQSALSTFSLSSVRNNFLLSGILHQKDLDDDETIAFKQDVKREFTGEENANMLMVTNGENPPIFIPIPSNNNADVYKAVDENAVQKICSVHNLNSPTLAGLPTQGANFGTSELSIAFEYFVNTTIRSLQLPILDFFNEIFRFNKLIDDNEYISIESLNAVQFKFDSNVLLSVLSKNELRAEMGYGPREDGNNIGNSPIQTQVNITNPSTTPSSDTQPTNDVTKPERSKLFDLAGGLDSLARYQQQVTAGLIPLDIAVNALMKFFLLPENEARALLPSEESIVPTLEDNSTKSNTPNTPNQ